MLVIGRSKTRKNRSDSLYLYVLALIRVCGDVTGGRVEVAATVVPMERGLFASLTITSLPITITLVS